MERPYSRYTRERSWAALYSQHINAGFALVPFTTTENSVNVINCKDASQPGQDLAKDTQGKIQELLATTEEIADYYRMKRTPDTAPDILRAALADNRLLVALVLARSSDYYRYDLENRILDRALVVAGIHDSYLHVPCWELATNKRYKSRETSIAIGGPGFDQARKTPIGHSILLAAYAKGNDQAIAFVAGLKERTRIRLKSERDDFQGATYRGRPLAFRDEAKRNEVRERISQGMILHYARKRNV